MCPSTGPPRLGPTERGAPRTSCTSPLLSRVLAARRHEGRQGDGCILGIQEEAEARLEDIAEDVAAYVGEERTSAGPPAWPR